MTEVPEERDVAEVPEVPDVPQVRQVPDVRESSRWRLVLALAALHALTVFPYQWENVSLGEAWLRPSPDLALLLSLGCVGVLLSGAIRLVSMVGAAVVVFVPMYRAGVTLMPVYFGKEFEAHVDLHELPGLPHLLLHSYPVVMQVLLVVLAVVLAGGLLWLLNWAVVVVMRACTGRRFACGLLVACQLLVFAGWVVGTKAAVGDSRLWRAGMLRTALDYGAALVLSRDWRVAQRFGDRADSAARELAGTPTDAAGLAGADVYVLFIESYGRDTLTGSRKQACELWLGEGERELVAAGFSTCSGWIEPAVRGGGSTMAHAEFLSGIRIPDRRYLDLLLASDAQPLPAILRDAGYHTVDVQPAMPREWPEAAFFGFEQELFRPALPYEGQPLSLGRSRSVCAQPSTRDGGPAQTQAVVRAVRLGHQPRAVQPDPALLRGLGPRFSARRVRRSTGRDIRHPLGNLRGASPH